MSESEMRTYESAAPTLCCRGNLGIQRDAGLGLQGWRLPAVAGCLAEQDAPLSATGANKGKRR